MHWGSEATWSCPSVPPAQDTALLRCLVPREDPADTSWLCVSRGPFFENPVGVVTGSTHLLAIESVRLRHTWEAGLCIFELEKLDPQSPQCGPCICHPAYSHCLGWQAFAIYKPVSPFTGGRLQRLFFLSQAISDSSRWTEIS